jgi:Family of unknown function (DUF6492)
MKTAVADLSPLQSGLGAVPASQSFVLYCKSYAVDLQRVVRLARSVVQFNQDQIPFYVSVPAADLPLFRRHLAELGAEVLADESIIAANPSINPESVDSLPGHLSQQVVKSEFWRLNLCQMYLCLDSDAFFIRPFCIADFVRSDGVPYTMLDQGHDLLEDALRHGHPRVIDDFHKEAALVQALFDRTGKAYSFGPFPLVWHRAVWESLEVNFLLPRHMNLVDAICSAPIESRWYGESLLRYKAIPLLPAQALFKVYHYAWQLDQDRRRGLSHKDLAQLFCGVIHQSAWERSLDWPAEGGSLASRVGRRIRRKLGRM